MILRKSLIALGLLAGSVSASFAGYTITRTDGGNSQRLVQGKWYEYRITNTNIPVNTDDVSVEINNCNYDFQSAALSGSNGCHGIFSVDSPSGDLLINFRFNSSSVTYSITVRNTSDPIGNVGSLNNINVQKYPVSFSVTPSVP